MNNKFTFSSGGACKCAQIGSARLLGAPTWPLQVFAGGGAKLSARHSTSAECLVASGLIIQMRLTFLSAAAQKRVAPRFQALSSGAPPPRRLFVRSRRLSPGRRRLLRQVSRQLVRRGTRLAANYQMELIVSCRDGRRRLWRARADHLLRRARASCPPRGQLARDFHGGAARWSSCAASAICLAAADAPPSPRTEN